MHRALGLSDDELLRITTILGREPNHLELAMFAVMWSEHCSYKSSRIHLRRLPTQGPGVLVGPGENAGVVDAGDGIAVALRIESHNHPSAVEPHQGAATGVGGILRDVFTMGARPLALMDPLFFGDLDDPRQRWLFEGVVGGISSYANAVGVPTIGGELTFDRSYARNPLVNVLCLGALPVGRLVLAKAAGVGNLVILLGSATGRDGIGGVSVLASAGFAGAEPEPGSPIPGVGERSTATPAGGAGSDRPLGVSDDAKRPSVQVGDPFEEKRLIEACLELLDRGLVVAVQDLGGAGLTCAASETAARGGVGMDIDVAAVPRREPGMAPWEVMTSESQERMLAIVTPQDWPAVAAVCERWEVRAAIVGTVTAPVDADGAAEGVGRLRVLSSDHETVLADVPARALASDAPIYDRPRRPPADHERRAADDPADLPPGDCTADLLSLLADPSWVYRQYDHQLFLNTVAGPGEDAGLLRLAGPGLPPSRRGMAVTTDSAPRWCAIDPRVGTAWVLAEAIANLACVGATPAAVVNCLNFGNPEHPEVMWQFSEAVDGLAEACRAFGLAVVGGNVSFYNESGGVDIDPTPVIGLLGFVEQLARRPPGIRWEPGCSIVVLGGPRAHASTTATGVEDSVAYPLAGSRWAVELRGHRGGRLPALDASAHASLTRLVAALVAEIVAGSPSAVCGVHDVSAGGLGVALAEMAARSGVGCAVELAGGHAELFGELPSRIVVATRDPQGLFERAGALGVPAVGLGEAGGERFVVSGLCDVSCAELTDTWKGAIPRAVARVGARS